MVKLINCQTAIDLAEESLGKLTPEDEKVVRSLVTKFGVTPVINSINLANFQRKYREEPISLPEFFDLSATNLKGWIEMQIKQPAMEEDTRLFADHKPPHKEIW
ncbi:MAG TPA: hypothetical protein VF185_02370 [Patescibacteria group bacterium]